MLVYNGEVYNFKSLRVELEALGNTFATTSDTEVVLAAIAAWGVEAAARKFVGMFAFGILDQRRGVLSLVSDRLGIKPLAFFEAPDALSFASEVTAVSVSDSRAATIDYQRVSEFMAFGYVPANKTIVNSVKKVAPGTIEEFSCQDSKVRHVGTRTYYSAVDLFVSPERETSMGDLEALEQCITEAVDCRLVSDVPLGAFLSGGFDSTLVVALAQRLSRQPVKTFSIGYKDAGFDESQYAASVASHLGTEHSTCMLGAQDVISVVPEIARFYDEPFADWSQVPTFMVSKFAREHVTVCLSGDGGDELFGGYNRHLQVPRMARLRQRLPRPVISLLQAFVEKRSDEQLERFFDRLFRVMPKGLRFNQASQKLRKLNSMLSLQDAGAMYTSAVTYWDSNIVEGTAEPSHGTVACLIERFGNELGGEEIALLDMVSYLPDDILTKVDRASMANGLEARVPLLDHRILEYSARLDWSAKIVSGSQKVPLRQLVYRHVPSALMDRPKTGFDIPLHSWLRGELRDWAESLLGETNLKRHNLLSAPILDAWHRHNSAGRNEIRRIWPVLAFLAWYESWQSAHAKSNTALRVPG